MTEPPDLGVWLPGPVCWLSLTLVFFLGEQDSQVPKWGDRHSRQEEQSVQSHDKAQPI